MATLIKLSDDVFNGRHPNEINQGHTSRGEIYKHPKVGDSAIVGDLKTSTVTEILNEDDDKVMFKTKNSTYMLFYDNKS